VASTSTAEDRLPPDATRGELLAEVGRLLVSLGRDPRVPWRAKAVVGAALAYAVTPSRVLPTPLRQLAGGFGALDNTVVLLAAVRHLIITAGYDLVREQWQGTDRGFAIVLLAAGVRS
jgi:uncharacterized membrane protein YkvA (DUF1232 family)